MRLSDLPPGVSVFDPHINPPAENPDRLRIRKVFGRRVRLHASCADGFRSDRKHGLIYPSYDVDGTVMSVEQASIEAGFCAYCNGEE